MMMDDAGAMGDTAMVLEVDNMADNVAVVMPEDISDSVAVVLSDDIKVDPDGLEIIEAPSEIVLPEEACDMTGAHIGVPEVVASETVVTTSSTPSRQKKHTGQLISSNLSQDSNDHSGLLDDSSRVDTIWAHILEGKNPCSGDEMSENDLNSSQESFVALMPESSGQTCVLPSFETHESSIREITKRERDRVKKRELRKNPAFREREKEKAKARMRNKRADPMYRAVERQKDRLRRRQARQRDIASRSKERERDKQYKRMQRLSVGATGVKNEVEIPDEVWYLVK